MEASKSASRFKSPRFVARGDKAALLGDGTWLVFPDFGSSGVAGGMATFGAFPIPWTFPIPWEEMGNSRGSKRSNSPKVGGVPTTP